MIWRLLSIILLIALCGGTHADERAMIQFRLNCNYFSDESEARQNCRNIRRHIEIFEKYGVKASYWFTWLAAEQIQRLDPELIQLINRKRLPVGHHGANRKPHPRPVDRIKGENWEEDVAAIMDYETHAINPVNGRLDMRRQGGLKALQAMFHNRIRSTGRFFETSILFVTKKMGCEAMIGLAENTGSSINAAWFMGMKNMPDTLSIIPRQLRMASLGKLDLRDMIERAVREKFHSPLDTVAVLVHDTDFLSGSPEMREKLWKTYEDLVAWAARNPRLSVVTYEEIIDSIRDDRSFEVSRESIVRAARIVREFQKAPPQFIALDGGYLSLADAFQAFTRALIHFGFKKELPASVTVRDILGPTTYRREEKPERGRLDFPLRGRPAPFQRPLFDARLPTTPRPQMIKIQVPTIDIIKAAHTLDLSEKVPHAVTIAGIEVNPAVFLNLMAQAICNIAAGRKSLDMPVYFGGEMNVLPLEVQRNRKADALTKLQFWTLKPERPRVTNN